MARDDMTIRLHLRRIRVVGVLVDTISRLVVEVESTWSVSRCRWCGFKTKAVHDVRPRRVRDRRMGERAVTLVWKRRRFVCESCGERHLEEHPEFEGNLTRRLARQLVADARVMSVSAVARREGIGWHKIMSLVSSWAERVAEHRRRQRCRVLLVDETSIRRRHRYVTVVLNGETGHILAMVEHRSTAALAGFFQQQTPGWRRGVKVVVSDGSRAYKSAIDTWIPNARHVLDRFHVIRWFTAGLTAVRRDIQRRPEGTQPAFDPDVFRARFALLRRGDQLSEAPSSSHPTRSWPATPGYRSPGTPYKNSTVSTWPRTTTVPSPPWVGSLTSTPPVKLPEFQQSRRHRNQPGETKSWPGIGAGDHPTADSKEPTTSSKSYEESPTASPTRTITQPEDSS